MGYDKRASAKQYALKDGDTLQRIAERETAAGNKLTWQDLAKFNWGTDSPEEVNRFLRDELGCYKRDDANGFVVSADAKAKGKLLIPVKFTSSGLATTKTHTLKVKKQPPPPQQFRGCARVKGICFEFASSFIRPTVVDDLKRLEEELKKHPDGKVMIFGHTDKVGSDEDNKSLSERRARSVYAFITNDADEWEKLYNDPKDKWGLKVVQTILKDLGHDPGPIDGVMGEKTRKAIKSFDPSSSDNTPDLRKKLFKAYMTGKHDVKLDPAQFMDPKHMGCSEFNPLVETDQACEANRRVTFYIFHKDRLPKLPCKTGDLAPCRQQVSQPLPRHRDSFHCSFYDSIAKDCPCENGPPPPPPPPATAVLEIVTDDKDAHAVDQNSPVATFVRMGIWDNAYDASGNVKNGAAETDNFVGADKRRFYFRVRDDAATTGEVNINWKTLKQDATDDDVPASQQLTLVETAAGSKSYVSRAVLLVTDDTDCDQTTNSGLPATHADTGDRARGNSNHRTRRARLDGFIRAEYAPAGGGAALSIQLPIFERNPDERRRLNARVINYSIGGVPSVNEAYIDGQFEHANARWNQVGLQIDRQASVSRAIPPAALNAANLYAGSANNANEQAALNDLIPITPDNTVTVVFVQMTGSNAYATIGQRNSIPQPPPGAPLTLGDRYFIFVNAALNLNGDTLAHEFHHVLFNRFDTNVPRQFYTFNTSPSNSFGLPLPDVRVRRRIQNLHSPDPDQDATNNNILNWYRRARTVRFPIPGGTAASDATTGNKLVGNF